MEEPAAQSANQKRSAIVALVVLVVIVAAALAGYAAISSMRPQTAPASASAQGYPLSDGAQDSGQADKALACQLVASDGSSVTLADVSAGKPVVLNMWATWCPYCVAEMDDYQKLYDEFGDRASFAMVNACDTSGEITLARDYIVENGYTFPVYYDANHQVMRLVASTSLPVTAIMSADGSMLMNRVGQIDYDRMRATLAQLAS